MNTFDEFDTKLNHFLKLELDEQQVIVSERLIGHTLTAIQEDSTDEILQPRKEVVSRSLKELRKRGLVRFLPTAAVFLVIAGVWYFINQHSLGDRAMSQNSETYLMQNTTMQEQKKDMTIANQYEEASEEALDSTTGTKDITANVIDETGELGYVNGNGQDTVLSFEERLAKEKEKNSTIAKFYIYTYDTSQKQLFTVQSLLDELTYEAIQFEEEPHWTYQIFLKISEEAYCCYYLSDQGELQIERYEANQLPQSGQYQVSSQESLKQILEELK